MAKADSKANPEAAGAGAQRARVSSHSVLKQALGTWTLRVALQGSGLPPAAILRRRSERKNYDITLGF